MEKDKFVILSKDVANAIFSYLGSKPYTEVSEVINAMMSNINQNAQTLTISPKLQEAEQDPASEKVEEQKELVK